MYSTPYRDSIFRVTRCGVLIFCNVRVHRNIDVKVHNGCTVVSSVCATYWCRCSAWRTSNLLL